jgi:hypothetical protein
VSFEVEVDDSRLRARLSSMPEKLRAALIRKTTVLRLQLEAKVKAKTPVKTGALRRSEFSDQTATATTVEARVASSADVKYARYVEQGTQPHDIVPSSAKALAFVAGGKQVFARRVHHPGTKGVFMFRDSLIEMRPAITEGYRETVKEASL